jgi:type I restriction enzyme S subunit
MSEQGGLHELPRGWASTTSGELCAYITSGSRDWRQFYSPSGALFIRTQDINTDKLILEDVARVSLPDDVEGKRSLVEPDDLLVTITGANVGKVAVVPEGIQEAYVSQSVGLLKLKDKRLAKFFHYYLQAEEAGRGQLNRMVYGVGRPVLSLQNLREIPIQLPPLDEQRRIVAKIEELFTKLDVGVEALRTARAQLRRYRQAVLKAAVTGELTKEWREAHRGELEPASELLARILRERREKWEADQLAKMKAAGKTPKNDEWKMKYVEPASPNTSYIPEAPNLWTCATWSQLSNWVTYGFTRPMPHVKDGVPIVTAKNISNGRINFTNTHKTPYEAFSKLSEKDCPKVGDILITKDGAIGRASVVETNEPFCINQSVAVVWLRSYPAEHKFLFYVIESPLTQKPIWEKVRGVAIQHLSITDFAKMTLLLPPLGEQRQIVEEVERALSIADATEEAIEQGLRQAERLRQSILKRAFEGKLVPLLARIRGERAKREAAPPKKGKGRTRKAKGAAARDTARGLFLESDG